MIFKWSIFLFRLWCQNKSYNNFKIFYKRLDLDFYIKFKSKFCRSVLWMLSISENKIYKRLCASGTPAGSVSWFIELCKDGGGDNRRFRISKKKKKKFGKGRGRSGSCSGLCRFTYFNGSSCTSGPRKVCLPFFHLIISSLLSILRSIMQLSVVFSRRIMWTSALKINVLSDLSKDLLLKREVKILLSRCNDW